MPALIAAAACSEDSEGDLGDGGLGRDSFIDGLRCLCSGEPERDDGVDGGSEFRSGGISMRVQRFIRTTTAYCWTVERIGLFASVQRDTSTYQSQDHSFFVAGPQSARHQPA